jgi:hypothetical protein
MRAGDRAAPFRPPAGTRQAMMRRDADLGLSWRTDRRRRRGTFAFATPVPSYRRTVDAVFGHLLAEAGDAPGGEPPQGEDRGGTRGRGP